MSQARHPPTKDAVQSAFTAPFRELVGGIVPGYAGHVPKAAYTYGISAQGATQPFSNGTPTRQTRSSDDFLERLVVAERADMMPIEPANPLGSEGGWWPVRLSSGESSDSFRNMVGGVIPGYAGHIPKGQFKTGEAKVGRVPRGMPINDPSKLSQVGIPNTKVPQQRIP